ncbi:MAG: hypothetical protein KUG69_10090 [Marinosulfonomonas sp.]|nr:hypothetical protein [Marinosulfonomonas sp.]
MKNIRFALFLFCASASGASAADIERACVQSGRDAVSRTLCGCIQDVANLTLSGADQKLASSFFGDPHKAQEIRQSDRRSHEKFWERYKEFGQAAKTFCS